MGEHTLEILESSIVNALQDIKGEEIKILNLEAVENRFCDRFILCNGTSSTHVSAIAGSVERSIRKALKIRPLRVEKTSDMVWVLMDYMDVVVHIFQSQARESYNLENLWDNVQITTVVNN